MLKEFSVILLMFFSHSVWSFGSKVFLGNFVIPPGKYLRIEMKDTKIYEHVDYKIDCVNQMTQEDTAIELNAYNLKGNVYIYSNNVEVQEKTPIQIRKNQSYTISFVPMVKRPYSYIYIGSLDTSDSLTFECNAYPN